MTRPGGVKERAAVGRPRPPVRAIPKGARALSPGLPSACAVRGACRRHAGGAPRLECPLLPRGAPPSPATGVYGVIEAIMLWNEPNNVSHWDRELDPEWRTFAEMCRLAAREIRAVAPHVRLVLGGISPIDPNFLRLLAGYGLLAELDVIALHGFPYDWNLWHPEEWPRRIDAIRDEFGMPVWVTETGVSSWASEENMAWGVARLGRILRGRAERVHWYTLLDLPAGRVATTRHGPAEGSSYWRHFHFGLLREDGSPKPALSAFDPAFGICQWFHFGERERLELAVDWLVRLGVRHLRTGLSWAEWHIPGAEAWFDRIVEATAPFQTTLTLCFTPPSAGIRPHHTSPPRDVGEFAAFARWVACHYLAPR